MQEIWADAVATFLGNALLISVVYGFWKASKVYTAEDDLSWAAICSVIVPLFLIGSTVYLNSGG